MKSLSVCLLVCVFSGLSMIVSGCDTGKNTDSDTNLDGTESAILELDFQNQYTPVLANYELNYPEEWVLENKNKLKGVYRDRLTYEAGNNVITLEQVFLSGVEGYPIFYYLKDIKNIKEFSIFSHATPLSDGFFHQYEYEDLEGGVYVGYAVIYKRICERLEDQLFMMDLFEFPKNSSENYEVEEAILMGIKISKNIDKEITLGGQNMTPSKNKLTRDLHYSNHDFDELGSGDISLSHRGVLLADAVVDRPQFILGIGNDNSPQTNVPTSDKKSDKNLFEIQEPISPYYLEKKMFIDFPPIREIDFLELESLIDEACFWRLMK